ncbi:MAG: LytTR family DNA-binding domain-containing protein [Bacteroidota bacterium]
MLRAIIVDDEPRGREILEHLIREYCPDVEVVGMAEDVLSGMKAIHKHQPDIVFLDIEMPIYSGFKLIESFEKIDFDIIFTTAYDHYAIKAFKVSAAGYLLKPIDIEELIAVVEKVKKRRQQLPGLQPSIANNAGQQRPKRLVLPAQSGQLYVNPDEIHYMRSEGRYTHLHLTDNSQLTTNKSLRDCHDLVDSSIFIRIHRSYIINLRFIKRYAKGRDSFVLMQDQTRLDVGKHYKEELAKKIELFLR